MEKKLILFFFTYATISMQLHAMEQAALNKRYPSKLAHTFKTRLHNTTPQEPFFNEGIQLMFSNSTNHVARKVLEPTSPFDSIWQDCSKTTLNEMLQDPTIRSYTTKYWHTITSQKRAQSAYNEVITSLIQSNKAEKRATTFEQFKGIMLQNIKKQINAIAPFAEKVSREPENTLVERALISNKSLDLSQSQIAKYKSLLLISFALKQIHYNIDLESFNYHNR